MNNQLHLPPRPMLATDFDEKLIEYPCFVQPKFNGIRAIYKNGRFYSRDLKQYSPGVVEHITECMAALPQELIFDGEFYRHGWPLQRINAACAVNRKYPTTDTKEIVYVVFDIVDTRMSQVQRMFNLASFARGPYWASPCSVAIYPAFGCRNDDEADKHYEDCLAKGFEGIVYRMNKPYFPSARKDGPRAKCLVRRKPWKDMDVEVIGLSRGKDKYADTLGAFVCVTRFSYSDIPLHGEILKEPDEAKIFTVSGGLTDIQRSDYWAGNLARPKKLKIRYETLSEDGIPLKPTIIQID